MVQYYEEKEAVMMFISEIFCSKGWIYLNSCASTDFSHWRNYTVKKKTKQNKANNPYLSVCIQQAENLHFGKMLSLHTMTEQQVVEYKNTEEELCLEVMCK